MKGLERALEAVGAILDDAIALDPDAPARIERLAGRSLEVEVAGTGLRITLVPEDGHVRLTTEAAEAAAVRIVGPPASLVGLAGREGTRVLFDGAVRVEGDVAAARAWKRLFDALEPDWEEALARIAGDIPARETGRLAAAAAAWARRARAGRAADLRAWLINEVELLPARHELEAWLAGVDRLRHDTDRLAARVARLERSRERP